MFKHVLLVLAAVMLAAHVAHADTPAMCAPKQFVGEWVLSIGPTTDYAPDCTKGYKAVKQVKLTLHAPDVVTDSAGNVGFWTGIYGQGPEIVINNQKAFFFSDWTKVGKNVTSFCDRSHPGTGMIHDADEFAPKNWACFDAQMTSAADESVPRVVSKQVEEPAARPYASEATMVHYINALGGSWHAKTYDELFAGKTVADVTRMSGVPVSRMPPAPKLGVKKVAPAPLPESFDWTNVDGESFVPDVRNQLKCGSCYTFGSTGTMMSKIRIATQNKQQPELAPQYLVSCSNYSQGCDGGFAYLMGKWSQDFGIPTTACAPYNGTELACSTFKCDDTQRWYMRSYEYIGGYYGAGNEHDMMQELVTSGPIAVGFEVHPDFMHYAGGVYTYKGLDRFSANSDGLIVTNHAVFVVGYGVENGLKYWKVQNSWGTTWGEDGYFRILRGSDECGIESMPVAFEPVIN